MNKTKTLTLNKFVKSNYQSACSKGTSSKFSVPHYVKRNQFPPKILGN